MRGYGEDEVQIQIDKASILNRRELFEEREKEFKQVSRFMVTYHSDPSSHHILTKYQQNLAILVTPTPLTKISLRTNLITTTIINEYHYNYTSLASLHAACSSSSVSVPDSSNAGKTVLV